MLNYDKGAYVPRVLANFLIATYGQDALEEAHRRALRQHSIEDADITEFWAQVYRDIAHRKDIGAETAPGESAGDKHAPAGDT